MVALDGPAARLRVVPSPAHLPVALCAGVIWLPTAVWMTSVPARVRDAHLDRLVTGEGLVWFWLSLSLLAMGLLLGLATWLSVLAHGNRRTAARAVVVARVVTWTVYCALLLGAMWIEGTWTRECWRSCAPFPS